MIHTVEIRTKSLDYAVFKKFRENPGLLHQFPGIEFSLSPGRKGKYIFCHELKAKVTLNRVIDPENYLGLYSGKDADKILATINQVFSELELPAVHFWSLSRVDFTVDIETPYVSEYLYILAHGDHKQRPTHKSGSVRIPYSDRGVTVNFYDKSFQQSQWGEEAAEKARGILRLEVQCHDKKLATLFAQDEARPYRNLPSLLIVNQGDSAIDMVQKSVGKELVKIAGICDHIRLDEAISKVKAIPGKQQRVLLQIEHILTRINRKNGSIRNTKIGWCKGAGASETVFRARMAVLYNNGINPICLPSDSPIDRLENLYQLYLAALAAECNTEE